VLFLAVALVDAGDGFVVGIIRFVNIEGEPVRKVVPRIQMGERVGLREVESVTRISTSASAICSKAWIGHCAQACPPAVSPVQDYEMRDLTVEAVRSRSLVAYAARSFDH
jgi:hypothetical protein